MKYTWYNYPKKIDEELVDQIVQDCLKQKLKKGRITMHYSPEEGRQLGENANVRRAKITFIDRYKHPEIYQRMWDIAVDANLNAYNFDISTLEILQFTLYESKDSGKYDWHQDSHWDVNSLCDRKLSIVVQLSNPSDYEGGEFELFNSEFTGQDKIDLKQKGTVITFPSFIKHRVKPVTKGERMSLFGWLTGPKFR